MKRMKGRSARCRRDRAWIVSIQFMTLEEVKEAVVKVTQQLEEDDENIDLKVLEEFTEEYEKMSETQVSNSVGLLG